MSLEKLQQNIRRRKTPGALGLRADETVLKPALLRQFTEMYGEGPMATAEALRYHGCRAIESVGDILPAVYLHMDGYLRYGSVGLDVMANLAGAAQSRGCYVIADCRVSEPEAWFHALPGVDAVTVSPYGGGENCSVPADKAVFALLRTTGGTAENLMAGDRKLYLALADQMARRGAGCIIETGFSLDIREVRKKQEKLFLLLTNCDADSAAYAFDDYGRGALVVDDTIHSAADIGAAAQQAVKAMKQVVTVL